jgi:hypothetical protein
MKSRTVGSIALGPTGNLQGGIRCYSLVNGRILQRDRNSCTPLKMPEHAVRQMKTLTKNSVPGLHFGDINNIITDLDNDAIITGVNENDDDDIIKEHPYDIQIVREDNDDPPLQDPTPVTVHLKAVQQTEDNTSVDGDDRYNDDSQPSGVALENAADEVDPPTDNHDDSVADNEIRARSGRVSRPLHKENEYPSIYYTNGKIPEGRCLKLYYETIARIKIY